MLISVDDINIKVEKYLKAKKMRRTINKRVSMLMMVMIMLIVATIIALKLMPDEQTQVIREKEAFYNTDLSQLREAIDMARLASNSEWIDFCATDTPEIISVKIASLSHYGFLRNDRLRDNSIPEHLWGTSTDTYWIVSTNYASNTSFEIASGDWSVAWEKEANASATMIENIRLNSMSIDEYPYQNKLGDNTREKNKIRMIKIIASPTVAP